MGFLNGSIPAPTVIDLLFPQWERGSVSSTPHGSPTLFELMVIQHEHQQPNTNFSTNEPNLFANAAMNRSQSTTNKANSSKKCSYCHRYGHTWMCAIASMVIHQVILAISHRGDAFQVEEKENNEGFSQDPGLNLIRAQFQHNVVFGMNWALCQLECTKKSLQVGEKQ
ncbi:hypothetical protein V8G54_003715 [Vigna mungo]|uniref:Uncharacterized protein n=1 Tax=Vigna mungo TaxID=3915 RepID=A0AAQ3SE45_VIGMU